MVMLCPAVCCHLRAGSVLCTASGVSEHRRDVGLWGRTLASAERVPAGLLAMALFSAPPVEPDPGLKNIPILPLKSHVGFRADLRDSHPSSPCPLEFSHPTACHSFSE